MYGNLGAGKTYFTSHVLANLNSLDRASSPTFTIFHEYETPSFKLIHMDGYRIKDAREANYIGLDEYMDGKNVLFIEWPEIVLDKLPNTRYEIKLEVVGDKRSIKINKNGEELKNVYSNV